MPDLRTCEIHPHRIAFVTIEEIPRCSECFAKNRRYAKNWIFHREEVLEVFRVYRAALEAVKGLPNEAEKTGLDVFLQTLNVLVEPPSSFPYGSPIAPGVPRCPHCSRRAMVYRLKEASQYGRCQECLGKYAHVHVFDLSIFEALLGQVERAARGEAAPGAPDLLQALEINATTTQIEHVCILLRIPQPRPGVVHLPGARSTTGSGTTPRPGSFQDDATHIGADAALRLKQPAVVMLQPCAACQDGIGLHTLRSGGAAVCSTCAHTDAGSANAKVDPQRALELIHVYRAALAASRDALDKADADELCAFLRTLNVLVTESSAFSFSSFIAPDVWRCSNCLKRAALYKRRKFEKYQCCQKCCGTFPENYVFDPALAGALFDLIARSAQGEKISGALDIFQALEVTASAAQLERVCALLGLPRPPPSAPRSPVSSADAAPFPAQPYASVFSPCAKCQSGIGILVPRSGGAAVCSTCAQADANLQDGTIDSQRALELACIYSTAVDALEAARGAVVDGSLEKFLYQFNVDTSQETLDRLCDLIHVDRMPLCPDCGWRVPHFAVDMETGWPRRIASVRCCPRCFSTRHQGSHWEIAPDIARGFATLFQGAAQRAAGVASSVRGAQECSEFLAALRVSVSFEHLCEIRTRFPSATSGGSPVQPDRAEYALPRLDILLRFANAICVLQDLPTVALKEDHVLEGAALLFYDPDAMVVFTLAATLPEHKVSLESFRGAQWGAAADLTLRAAQVLLSARTDAELAVLRFLDVFRAKAYAASSFPCARELVGRLKSNSMNSSQALFDLLDAHTTHDGLSEDAADQRLCDRVRALNHEMVRWAAEWIEGQPFAAARFPFLAELYRDALRCFWNKGAREATTEFHDRMHTRLQREVPEASPRELENVCERCARSCVAFVAAHMQPEVSYRPRFRIPEDRPFVVMPEWVTADAAEDVVVDKDTLE